MSICSVMRVRHIRTPASACARAVFAHANAQAAHRGSAFWNLTGVPIVSMQTEARANTSSICSVIRKALRT
eukprot:5047950-Lingulodinium_polyedra.AAC.1